MKRGLSTAGKYKRDRQRLPRAWARGRYVRVQVLVALVGRCAPECSCDVAFSVRDKNLAADGSVQDVI